MVVGLNLSNTEGKFRAKAKFIIMILTSKLIILPGVALSFILLDRNFFHLYSPDIHKVFFLFAALPPSTNVLIVSKFCRCYPEEVAAGILVSTIAATIYIPFIIQFL